MFLRKNQANFIKELLALYKSHEDLISIGAYATGANPKVDLAIMLKDKIDSFLKQDIEEKYSFKETLDELDGIYKELYGQEETNEKEDLLFQ